MELSTEIKFSNNLIKNRSTYISYSGNLYKQNSNSVYILYGYGNNWAHTTEQRMTKNSNGFVAKVCIPEDFDNINFCFRNQNNEWDNNNGSNYNAPIAENTEDYEENFIINEEIINSIADNLFKYDISKIPTSKESAIPSLNNVAQELFSNIYDEEEKNETIQEESSTADEENLEIIDNNPVDIENIEITDDTPINVEINPDVSNFIESIINEEINDEPEKIEEVEEINEIKDTMSVEQNETTENIDLLENSESYKEVEKIESENSKENNFNMDSLIEEILTPITNSNNFEKEDLDSLKKDSSFDFDINNMLNIQDEEKEIEKDKKIDNIITNYIDDLYENIDKNFNNVDNHEKTINKLEQIEQLDLNESSLEEISITENNIEESLIEDAINNQEVEKPKSEEKALIVSPRHVTPFYMTKKKIKVAFLKIFNFLPRLLSGKFNEEK